MTKLYQRSPLGFALLWIGIYVLSASLADGFSEELGIEKLITAPLLLGLSLLAFLWIRSQKLTRHFGLCLWQGKAKDYLYFLPLVLLASLNLWNGVQYALYPIECVLYILSMLGVGFLEEVIFRGFLFCALLTGGKTSAFVISSLSFAVGHIVNLFNGADLPSTLLQILYAAAAGFLFTLLFYRSGSLIPCIVTHGIFNSLSAFHAEKGPIGPIAFALINCLICLLYAGWIGKHSGDCKGKCKKNDTL